MADAVKIDKDTFHDRLSSFILQWKNDKRTGDALFGGVGSVAVVMGKADDAAVFQKNNAFQVRSTLGGRLLPKLVEYVNSLLMYS